MQIVASPRSMLGFLLVVRLSHLLIVGLAHLRWDAFHAENLKIYIIAIFEHIWHRFQLFLVYLLHVDPQAANCVQPPVAMRNLTFVVFRFLVIDENLQVVKVFVAVETPRSLQKLFQRRPVSLSLGFCHCAVC
jgi:hypothetical protein